MWAVGVLLGLGLSSDCLASRIPRSDQLKNLHLEGGFQPVPRGAVRPSAWEGAAGDLVIGRPVVAPALPGELLGLVEGRDQLVEEEEGVSRQAHMEPYSAPRTYKLRPTYKTRKKKPFSFIKPALRFKFKPLKPLKPLKLNWSLGKLKRKPAYKRPKHKPSYKAQATRKPSYTPTNEVVEVFHQPTKPIYQPPKQPTTQKPPAIITAKAPYPTTEKAVPSYKPSPSTPAYSPPAEPAYKPPMVPYIKNLPYKPPPVMEAYRSASPPSSPHPRQPSPQAPPGLKRLSVYGRTRPEALPATWREDFGPRLEQLLDLEARVAGARFPTVDNFGDNFRTTFHWGAPGAAASRF